MKSSHILAASIATVALVQTVSAADVTVRITGSSAFRSATTNGIKNVLSGGNPQIAYSGGSNFSNSTWQTFVGTIGTVTGTVTVKCVWSGAVAGIRDVAQSNGLRFLADGVSTSTGAGTSVAAPSTTAEGVADVAMGDNTQGSTTFKTPVLANVNKVGIIPFAFVASKDTPAGITNITRQQFNQTYTLGYAPSGLFTGDLVTGTTRIFAFGRDPFSGTRLNALAEPGYGTQVPVVQFRPTARHGGGSNNIVDNVGIYPATVDVPDDGNNGETSGGSLSDFMRLATTSVTDDTNGDYTGPAGFITYLGEADSYRAVFGIGNGLTGGNDGNARYLTYEGVAGFGGTAKSGVTVNITSGSAVVTLSAGVTTGLVAGQIITGTGIAPGSTITAVDSPAANQITLDKNATLTNAAQTGILIGALLPKTVRNGSYPFWNYEYMLWKNGTPSGSNNIVGTSGDKFQTAIAIRDRIKNFDYAFAGLADDASFLVQRLTDGGAISPK